MTLDHAYLDVVLDENGGFTWSFYGISDAVEEEILDNLGGKHFTSAIERAIHRHHPEPGLFCLRVEL